MLEPLKKIYRFTRSFYRKLDFDIALRKAGREPKVFYLMGLGDHFPNLGDQAQAAAIPMWIKQHFSRPLLEIKTDHFDDLLPLLKRRISSADIVFLHSGGNFGDDWYETQVIREKAIAALPNNCLIQLPQTVHYSDSEHGRRRLGTSKEVIGRHPKLMIFGRDKQSEMLCKDFFSNSTISARPDMVLSMQQAVSKELGEKIERRASSIRKVLLIMRNDKEGVFDSTSQKMIGEHLTEAGYETTLWDTDVKDIFPDGYKFLTLRRYLEFISSFDAVVTDRYHGLIFSVLVKRPCVVLKTHNHKLTSAFDWFEGVNFAIRANTNEEIVESLKWLEQLDSYRTTDWNAAHFEPMAAEVKSFLSAHQVVH